MAYDLKITGLANKDELVQQEAKDYRLYKFTLSAAPSAFWVLMLQQAGRALSDVTVSGNEGHLELWASAPRSVSVKAVLQDAKRAVAQANADATASDAQFARAAEEKAAALAEAEARFQEGEREKAEAAAALNRELDEQLVTELGELTFDDDTQEP